MQKSVAENNKQVEPFINTLGAGTKFVPVTESWSTIDAQGVFTGMYQKVVTGKADVNAATTEAATAMNTAFGSK